MLRVSPSDTTFEGPNAAKLFDALRDGLSKRRDRLPDGWYATIRYGSEGDEERIEL